MSHPILEMKAGYESDQSLCKIFSHDPQEIETIRVSNYQNLNHVAFYPNCEQDIDEHDTAVFHIKWKNTNQ